MALTVIDYERPDLLVLAKLSTCWLDETKRPIRWRWQRLRGERGETVLEIVALWLAVFIGRPAPNTN